MFPNTTIWLIRFVGILVFSLSAVFIMNESNSQCMYVPSLRIYSTLLTLYISPKLLHILIYHDSFGWTNVINGTPMASFHIFCRRRISLLNVFTYRLNYVQCIMSKVVFYFNFFSLPDACVINKSCWNMNTIHFLKA